MTTSKPPNSSTHELPWARVSLKLAGDRVDHEVFDRIVAGLGATTGAVAIKTAGDGHAWIDECPLSSDAPVEEQLGWAVREVQSVFGNADPAPTECRLELWLGIGVGAQLGVLLDSASLRRLADLGVEMVLDLYGWD